ncbi:hypothetical protein [Candidatus Rickettsia kedanie]|uniref:Lipoprotein n=1 Tax=Candidatus Rickettsia kedanie TaxID=3115352 RepID=A0ABP9TYF9_9RICK
MPLLLSACNKTEDNIQVNTPCQVAIGAMGKDFQIEISNLNISQKLSGAESPNASKVTIEQFGLLDDSISAIKDIFILSFNHVVNGQYKREILYINVIMLVSIMNFLLNFVNSKL